MNVYRKFTDMFKHNIKGTVQNIFLLLTLMTLGATSAWAQTDYSGTYLIKSRSANKKTAGDYYICPTEGWIYYTGTNSFTETDNGQPFLTTYQCKTGGYDVRKALWKIEKSGDYYTIKHLFDGKYMVYNGQISNANDGRIRIHLADVSTPDDNELFVIGTNSAGTIAISPNGVSNFFNVCQGNINSLAGSTEYNKKAKNDGPTTPTNHKNDIHGTIGLWKDINDENAPFEFEVAEVCETPTITYNESTHEVSMSTTTVGATIYYTTDGTEPTTSSSSYTAPFTVSNTTNIKAIAVKAGMYNSMTASKQLVKYTYNIVNRSGAIAIQYTTPYPGSVGTPLSGYSSIPEEIRSMYIRKETITFKSFDGAFSAAALEAADAITATPTTPNIYITYTTAHLMEEIIHLRGARQMNIKAGENGTFDNIYDSGSAGSGVLAHDAIAVTGTETEHLWLIGNNDPYAVTVRNIGTHNYLHYATPSTLSLDASPSYFILMAGSAAGVDPTYEQFELMAATGDDNYYRVSRSGDTFGLSTAAPGGAALQIQAHPNASSVNYILIDRSGRNIASTISSSGELRLPNDLWSPLVSTYHYWNESSFTVENGIYTLKSGQEEIEDISEATGSIFVTYDVNHAIDITGLTTYLMKFSDGADGFYPENGSNEVSGTAIKPIYPYNNGDFNLYIYGTAEWNDQLSKGATTRSRWLWYIVSNHNGTDLTGDAVDPYHVIIKSRQNQTYKVGETSYPGNSYFYTFKPNNDVGVVTGVITQHQIVQVQDPTLKPTEYMLLGTDVNHMTLKTINEIDGVQRTVDRFEQYWKNYPTVQTEAGVANPAADNSTLRAKGWHRYQSWANAEPWGGGTKVFAKGDHWFQTVSMGSGAFSVEEMVLEPEVILLDQHGWEIVRVPMSQTAKLKQYDSPMVQQYHWYPAASKESGYHKYTVSSQEIVIYDADGNATVNRYTHNSTSLADIPYDHITTPTQIDKVKSDFYVTYTVKSDYASAYVGAATAGGVQASSYFLKQGGKYAQNSSNTIALVDKPALTGTIPTNVQWKVKPNFNIDEEMGFVYGSGETSKSYIEAAYHAAGKNGFDPYNVQIQSVSDTDRFFTANTTNTVLEHGIWTGTGSTTNSLREMSVGHISADGYDQTTLDITNATFMVVDDGNGNMRLMPRFDNTKVMTSFTGLSTQLAAAAAGNNGEGTQSLVLELVPTVIASTDEILSMKGYYILAENFSLDTSIGSKASPFEGTLDGQLNHYTFDKPLVLYAKDATICNVILENSTLSTGNADGHLGAIACTAQGDSRIYNCGILAGSLSATEHVGGIVGHLDENARVINCYSYANITSGSHVGGIVGYNSVETNAAMIKAGTGTMVMNCAFYGDITGGSTKSPVYGGYNIANTHGGLNNYNYYAYAQLPSDHLTDNKYNTALAVADEDFQRFEFYRLLLNSNKRLAAYYATGSAANDHQMAKWVLETADRGITLPATPKAYPVLKAQGYYPSIINMDVENAPDSTTVGRNKGGKLGKTLRVHLSGEGITTTELTIDRTDKDFERYNFNYDKIQLPYFNDVGTGNYTNYRVVTGWEIISMTGGTAGTFNAADTWGGYNFADRKCTNKDLVGTSGRIFSQGAYFDVPYGVTDIYIQPHWATAAYVADEYLDVVYNSDYGVQKVTDLGKQFPNDSITINGSKQLVHKTIASAYGTFTKGSVYDYAVVLVGNLHQADVPLRTDAKRFTMMSADLDNDHEPDYSMIYHHTNRTSICPIRFDFLNVIGTAFAQKPNGATLLKNTTIFRTRGWFEVTNTALMYSNQMEYENLQDNTKEDAPLILLGGKFDQFVSTQSSDVSGKTIYIHVGGNVWIDQFGLGTHSDGSKSTPHVPVSVTGGEYKGFYLTGTYNQKAAVRTDNAECYISGGHFVEAAGACQEAINGNVQWQIYNADIDAFYGGGINAAKPITGNITTEIINSYVTTFCGGPKFGDMQTGKDVRTTATGCVFERYFGAGYGGTSYSRVKYHDNTSYNFTNLAKYYSPNDRGKYFDGVTTNSRDGGTGNDQYGKKGVGVATDFDYEFFVWSSGSRGARFFVKFASFSLANCIDVYSTLNNCTVNQNFYGGGSFGSVSGTATSVLNGCTVHGNVFGGGYSATREKVPVRNSGFTKIPQYNSNTGMFEAGTFSGTTEYEWKHVTSLPANGATGIEDDGDNHYLYTDVDLDALGKVGNTVLTIQGTTVVEGKIFQYDSNGKVVKDGSGNNVVLETSGGVFGGGDMSAVNHDTQVMVEATGAAGVLNVFGGGNTADVLENTAVTITGGTVGSTAAVSDTNGNVYGGGKGSTTVVGGNVTVNLGTKTGAEAPYTYTGAGLVKNNLYGGSALGAVNTTSGVTNVNIYAGTVNGSVFGGGLGQTSPSAIVAQNVGNTTVTVENSDNAEALVKTAVYGGANKNGVMKANTTLTITGGTVGTVPTGSDPITDVAFGGGLGEPTLVEGNVEVNIGTEGQASGGAVVNGHVYGGGALGSVNASKPASDLVFDDTKHTHVNLYKGLIKGNVYGGGLGQQASVEPVKPAIAAYVGGDVQVLLDGAQLECAFTGSGVDLKPLKGQIFGCNNLNGTPKGHVKVWVKRTVGTDKPTDDGGEPAEPITRDQRPVVTPPAYGYDVAAVYGGGNQADYIPADTELDPNEEGHEEENRTKINNANAEVLIEGCELTSIEYVYGGGNAAAVPATDVTILGSYIIDYVFGGGNGKGTGNPGANIGSYDNGTEDYGSGKAVTKLVGGYIMRVFGGSNTKGNVRGGTTVSMPDKASYESDHSCCDVRDIKEIYGAGNEAEQDGPVTMIVGCVDNMDYVYGGARNAHVKGGVDLVITSGHFKGVYGGNDMSGTIQGPIKLTIEETGCKPLEIDNLYLGGNQAAYSIYGYKQTGTDPVTGDPILVARSSMSDGVAVNAPAEDPADPDITEHQLYRNPVLNIVSCTRIGKETGDDLGGAFGGGYGAGATMYGNPTVNINMIPGDYANLIDRDGNGTADGDATALGIIRNVYGGGEQANVEGNTTVKICTEETVTVRTHMGAPVTNSPTAVQGALITENVFGAGKGLAEDVTSALVTGNTAVEMAGGSVGKSVYGGGQLSQVGGNTSIIVRGGEIGDSTGENAGETYGNVYGGGKGNTTNVRSGLVKGNTNITIRNTMDGDVVVSSPSIYHNIYGGGAHGSVGTYTYASEAADAAINGYTSGGTAAITITGGTIGVNGKENGMVFGSSRGDVGAPSSIYDKVAWVYNTNVEIGTAGQGTNHTSPYIKGSVYGGGENGHVYNNASVAIHSGMVGIAEGSPITDNNGTPEDPSDDITYTGAEYPYRGNVYGAGCGTDKYYSDPTGVLNPQDGNGDTYNPLSGVVGMTTTVLIDGGHVVRDVYGAGAMGSVKGSPSVKGSSTVTIAGNAEIGADGSGGGYVFAAARGDHAVPTMATVGTSTLNISGGTIWMDAYGGGQNGAVEGAVTVNMTGGTVKHDVYGGGALANTNTDNWDAVHSRLNYSSEEVTGLEVGTSPVDAYYTRSGAGTELDPYIYTPASGKAAAATPYYSILKATTVNLSGGTIEGNLYGGGLGQTSPSSIAANVYGPVTVNVSGEGTATNVFGCNNINGAPSTKAAVNITGGTVVNSAYGGGNLAAYTGLTSVSMSGGTANYVYGGGLGASAIVTGDTRVAISGGTVSQDVYGGGSQADVTGNVDVTVSGGTITHDVYGGGALANTNTGNWDAVNDRWSDQSKATYYAEVKHLTRYNPNKNGEGVYDPDEYAAASSVSGYYERSGVEPSYTYTVTSDVKAKDGVAYYKKLDNFLNVAANGTTYKTTVSLTGGTIGNAYGGGLGKYTSTGESTGVGAVAAMVYGDVFVTVDGTKFTQENERVDGKAIPTTGRVFGCNNKNGTPKGSVTVRVLQTKRLDGGSNHVKNQFEIQGVYGGGNMSEYLPDTYDIQTELGQSTHVIIEGCDDTSIERVYGGGNASDVPFSDVVIEGSFQIGYVFGGGNGGDKINKIGSWIDNPGANVTNYTNVLLKGGTIGEAFGGSDSKGTVGGSDLKTDPDGGCTLVINNIYGASKEADFDGDVTLDLSRCSGEVDKVFGGSYNANVRGNVTINITSGIYTSIYGGNDRKGTIGGNITINIEEVDQCNPIIIQNLFGGGSHADYPGVDDKTGEKAKAYKGSPYERGYKLHPESYEDFTRGNITINIKAATRIDRVFGGCDNAKATGNTAVNINMVKGSMAGNGFTVPLSYTGDPIPNIHTGDAYAVVSGLSVGDDVTNLYTRSGTTYTKIVSGTAVADVTYYQYLTGISCIDDAIGTIGYVYGGGNQGDVEGNTTVNIGTEKDVTFAKTPSHLTANASGKYDVLGAHIYGNVFGGGNEGDVTGNTTDGTGNTTVNIGTADYSGTANFEGIFIDKNTSGKGGSVFGGGNLADVKGNTNVRMQGGELEYGVYVFNGIFGGGYSGSVGTFTRSTAAAHTNVNGHTTHDGCIGKPISCAVGTGKCTVVVTGGQIGPVDVAKDGMNRLDANGGPVPEGWVWGAGYGVIEDPATHPDTHFKTYVGSTDVTIGGTAFILESVIGGGEFGRVLGNTLVKIQDHCQIGVGDGEWETVGGVDRPKRYTDGYDYGSGATTNKFIDPTTTLVTNENALAECSHFPYGNAGEYLPYDPYYKKYPAYVSTHTDLGPASTDAPSDGKTWIGCVFGGGSGYMPYEKADGSGYDWLRSAGWVEGNTTVQISGGHILTNVYGANEYTDVKGSATVTMTGGTLGVPRTLTQILNHPQTCYLFGGGKGDQRTHFNQWTDVGSVVVDVSGGIIYGSVFGGAEDGHVLGNASVTIRKGDNFTIGGTTYTNGPIIGTWGTSYVDGNVFGGGRGFSGEALTAGNIGGNVNVTITGGTMLGSVYGGGRLGSVGYELTPPTDPLYGVMQAGDSHGHVTVDISDATGKTVIGNKYESQYLTSNLIPGEYATPEALAAARKNELLTRYHIATPEYTYTLANKTGDFDHYFINHSRGGCVYGGGMGRRELLDGTKNTVVDWTKLGNVKTTTVNIHGTNVWIKGSVFGGGEFGAVTGSHTSADDKTVGTEVIINGATIGSVIGDTNDSFNATLNTDNRTQIGSDDDSRYTYGGVYGGGYGTEIDAELGTPVSQMNIFGALVSSNTSVKLQSGAVRSSVYGGGKVACVGGDTWVTVSGGTVGINQTRYNTSASMGANYVLFGGMRMGNVYGGGRGTANKVIAGLIKGNTNVAISGGEIYHNVYGGGALGSVGNFELTTTAAPYINLPVNWAEGTGTARVTITGGTFGTNGHDSGMICGSSRGDISTNQPASTAVSDPYDHLAWVKNTVVTIGTAGQGFDAPQPQIKGSVYGGGENGHNYGDAEVYIHSGTIGVVDTPGDTWSNRGSVYGAGCGTDTYETQSDGSDFGDTYNHYNPMGGRVQGNTTVSIDGGHVLRSVYGAGSMGSVDGNATVSISGGRIGTDGEKNNDGVTNGDVFGGPKGSLKIDPNDAHSEAHVENTTVTINYPSTPASDDGSTTHAIVGSVYGGGEAGVARGSVTVNMSRGLVKNNLYGGGALANTNTNNWNATAGTWADGKITTIDGKRVTTHKTTVNLTGGHIMNDVYGGALGRFEKEASGGRPYEAAIEPKVYGDILVELNKGVPTTGQKGCVVKKIFGCNDMEGTPMGHVTVHVYATQNAATSDISTKNTKYPKVSGYSVKDYSGLTDLADDYSLDVTSYIATLTGDGTSEAKTEALASMEEAVAAAVYASYASTLGVDLTGLTELEDQREAISEAKYDVEAVYGGGDLAPYVPADALSSDEAIKEGALTEVIIDGCELTSIKEVYGSGNAASTPGTLVTVYGTHEIDELFGGGNGKDNYVKHEKYYENPGANVGYYNYTTVYKSGDPGYTDAATNGSGTQGDPYKAIENSNASSKDLRVNNYSYGIGRAETNVYGGRIHNAYGGSNKNGNIRSMALSVYDDISDCPQEIDKTYGAGKEADIDGEIRVQLSCVDYMAQLFGGATDADVNADVTLTVTNGTFDKVFGGNDRSGTITGSITINIQENGCRPIVIGELYGAGNLAPYSVYGYNNDKSGRTKAQYEAAVAKAEEDYKADGHPDATREELDQELMRLNLYGFPKDNIHVNVISATKIGTIYGGGLGAAATVIGSPHVNVNMERGKVVAKYANKDAAALEAYTPGEHTDGRGDKYKVYSHETNADAILEIGTIGDIFGGGNASDILGNTSVEIGTGEWINWETKETETISRKAAFITGNVYGGGKMGHVGHFTTNGAGKPTSCAEGTGICTVTISNGDIGPDDMNMWHLDGTGNVPADDDPDNKGHVFGGGQGNSELPADDNSAFVDSTLVIINGTAWVKGSVFGGGENGHVLHNAGVRIGGECQIGNGHILLTDGSGNITLNRGVNRRYTAAEWAAGHLTATADDFSDADVRAAVNARFAHSLPECDSWLYGKKIVNNQIVASEHHSPYDKFAKGGGTEEELGQYTGGTTSTEGGRRVAASGRSFNGSVYGGGSGFFPYSAGNWNPKAGQVEGDTWVEVTGGHIMTSLYGGNEMSSMLGDAHVKMTGGTVGVPRTLDEIAAHPVTCYIFGGGKGEERPFLDNNTDVRNTFVTVSGGWVYGSVFGGAEDGHVLGNTKVIINGTAPTNSTTYAQLIEGDALKIGTWGTSYVDGNIFGGGRGFDGHNSYSGNVSGNATINVTGGEMLGSIYGGGRLGSVGYNSSSTMQTGDDHGNVTINISGSPVIGNTHEYVYWSDSDTPDLSNLPDTPFDELTSFTEKQAEDASGLITETASTHYRRLFHTKGGNVFGGSMGRIEKISGKFNPIWGKLGHSKSSTVTVSGTPIIRSSVYGGGEMGLVEGNATVTVSGGTIGSEIKKNGIAQYTFGCIYGGGYGSDASLTDLMAALTPAERTAAEAQNPLNPREYSGQVGGNTTVTMSDGWVKASVFGGGKMATVNGNATVTVSGGQVGLNKVRKSDGYVMYGSDAMGNVYGGGRGSLVYPLLGVVKGNTTVNIEGGHVYHMVYGGGALGSVGDFKLSNGSDKPSYIPLANVPYGWDTQADGVTPNGNNTGNTTVNITGGVIGISGRDNGLVFGSSRGNLKNLYVHYTAEEIAAALPGDDAYGKTTSNYKKLDYDPYDCVAWVKSSEVNIGTDGSSSLTTPLIKGSVYGGGENGHNSENATVNIYSGTIGIADKIPGTETADPWWDFGDEAKNTRYRSYRGNVYGGGSGADTYTNPLDDKEYYNPKSGMIGHNTEVNIKGGHVGRNVYGGGAMSMVGTIENANDTISTAKHSDETSSFALSWPYKFVFADNTGKATVNITGGHLGTLDTDGGDVYGSARGVVGDRYATAHIAYVKDTEVNIAYTSPPASTETSLPSIKTDFTIPCVTGSVHGSGENGYVYGDTKVTLQSGLIGHSLYGGGKGKDTYKLSLGKIIGSGTYEADIYSLIAGKVFGNTEVTMNGGHVARNVYGGGNLASVGKGNYAGGSDDYVNDCTIGAVAGYGEKTDGALWTHSPSFNPDAPISSTNVPLTDADYFLSSGKTTVKVFDGTVGSINTSNPSKSVKNNLPYGNVIGGSAGEPAPNIVETPRYHYSPAFFSGYVNQTDVTIGGYRCKAACTDKYSHAYAVGDMATAAELLDGFSAALVDGKPNPANWELVGPKILASVYGGGQDGHVRRDTYVRVDSAVIGLPFTEANKTLLKTTSSDITEVLNSPQWMHRGNVYGAGSGITKYKFDINHNNDSTETAVSYNGGTFKENDYSNSAGSVTRFTRVDINGGIINRNVYGGGSMGSVGPPNMGQSYEPYSPEDTSHSTEIGRQSRCLVNIAGTIGSRTDYQNVYGGEVYGASRGEAELKEQENDFSYVIWTKVNILSGAWVKGNVFGGGDSGMVKRDTEVNIGFPAP